MNKRKRKTRKRGDSPRGLLRRAGHGLEQPVDISSLVFVRVAFGLVMLWEVTRYFSRGWIRRYWIEPDLNFTYLGFDWITPWAGDGMYFHFAGLGILAVCIAIGFAWRLSATLFFLGFTYVFLLEQARYLNHFYLICLLSFLMIFLPAHRAYSWDTTMGWAKRSNTVPFWSVWILRFQLGVMYFYAGVAKINADWIRGEPMRMWLARREEVAVIGPLVREEWFIQTVVWGGLLLDLAIVPLLVWKRTRIAAFILIAAFHISNSIIWSIGIFPWMAIALTTIFFDPGWARRVFRLPLYSSDDCEEGPRGILGHSAVRKAGISLLAIYVAMQLLVPLRHWLYPGSVGWTDEGHMYSWRMKLRSRSGTTIFMVIDKKTGGEMVINPGDHLEDWQRDQMDTHVDMILQYVDFIEETLKGEGYPDIAVKARSLVSLNGRDRQFFFDPDIDLTTKRRTIRHQDWIAPLKTPLRTERIPP